MNEESSKLGTGLAWVGLIAMTTLVMIRAMVEHDAFPMWVSDPFIFSPPVIGLTPTKALILNLGVVLSCCTVLIGLYLRKEHFGTIAAILMTIGIAVVGHHGFHTFESVAEGSNLLAILAVLYVASCAHKIGGAQQLIAAITLGFAMLLVVMGAYEMFVIHPDTVASYEITRDSFLSARGWTPGSFEALAYERRLHQAEPIAWFGLTNVFASFVGAGAGGLLILGWSLRKSDRISTVYILCGLIAFAGLLMTQAKGGLGAFGLGVGLTIAVMLIKRKKLDGRAIVAMCGLVVLGVIARGLIGERIGELSLLFRSQYMVGSMRMFFENPLFGVAPGVFQDHYAIVKPDLSPEDVASAHSFGFDLLAMLGLGGLALFGLFLSIVSRIRPLQESDTSGSLLDRRALIQITMLIIAVASVISIRFNSPAMDTSLLAVQVFASVAWAGLAYLIIRQRPTGSAIQMAMFASASVLAIHSMIEVTGTWTVSGMLWALIIGSACTHTNHSSSSKPKPIVLLVLLALLGTISIFGMRVPVIARWERELNTASLPAIETAFQRYTLDGQLTPQLHQMEFEGRALAIEHLVEASKARPTHMPTRIAASEQMLWRAAALGSMGKRAESEMLWDRALELLEAGAPRSTGVGGYQWLGSVWYERANQFPESPSRAIWLAKAHDAWVQAFDRSPHNPHLAFKLMNLAIDRQSDDEVFQWANKALKLHEQSRLDPLRGLDEADLMRVRRYAR